MRKSFVSIALVAACGGGEVAKPVVAPLAPASSAKPAPPSEHDDLDGLRHDALAAIDNGDVARGAELAAKDNSPAGLALAAALSGPIDVLANVTPIKMGAIPAPPAKAKKEGTLAWTRLKVSKAIIEQRWPATKYFGNEENPAPEQAPPSWLPRKIGGTGISLLGSSDGRWLAIAARYVAIVGAKTTVLDVGDWTGGAEQISSIQSAALEGNTLYLGVVRALSEEYILAIDITTGAVRWRSEPNVTGSNFAIGTSAIVAWVRTRSRNELVTLAKDSGQVTARRASPEIESGEAAFVQSNGVVYALSTSELSGAKGLRQDEALELKVPAPPLAPQPPAPKAPAKVPALPPPSGADVRLAAWKALDHGAPREALLALGPILESRPTDLAVGILERASRKAYEAAREATAKSILEGYKPITASDTPTGPAPVIRPNLRKLKIVSKKAIQIDEMAAQFPALTDEHKLPPTWVPESMGYHRRNADAGGSGPGYRTEVYWEQQGLSWTLLFRDEKLVSILEQPHEARASDAIGNVVLSVNNDPGGFFLEAHDAVTGNLYYRGTEQLHDQYFIAEQGYVVLSTAEPNADIVLAEADTGKIVSRANLPPPQAAFLIFRRGNEIAAVSTSLSIVVALE